MASTVFGAGTKILKEWLNNVNDVVWGAFGGAATPTAARTALSLTSLATTTPGTGVATALAVNVGSAGAVVVQNGALGTPSSGTATNLTGTATALNIGGNAATATLATTATSATSATTATTATNQSGGTVSATTGTFSSTVTLSGTAANIATGANFISVGGTDAGLSFDASNNALFSASLAATTSLNIGGGAIGTGTIIGTFRNSAATGTTTGGNPILLIGSNASGADTTIQFTDAVANNSFISAKGGALIFQPTTAGTSIFRVISGGIVVDSGQIAVVSTATSTGTAVVHNADTGYYNLSSSRRYKNNITDIGPVDLKRFLALVPKKFDYKNEWDRGVINFIAEEAQDAENENNAGIRSLVNYNKEGQADSLRDYSFTAYQQLVLIDHDSRLSYLEDLIQKLEKLNGI